MSASDAGLMLGWDSRTVKRRAEEGRIPGAYKTPGGHWRIPVAGVESIRNGNDASVSVSASQSSTAAATKARTEELNAEIAEHRARKALKEFQDEERQEKEAAQAKAAELRQQDEEARREREQRQQEHRRAQNEARIKAQWQGDMLELAVGSVPRDAPHDLVLQVRDAVQEKLSELYNTSDDIAERYVLGIAARICRPWMKGKEADAISTQAVAAHLSRLAPDDWRVRAKENAIAAIVKLPDTANGYSMAVAATAAVKQADAEYRHQEVVSWTMVGVRRNLPQVLAYSSQDKRVEAEESVREAFSRLPIGASGSAFDSARSRALAPFLAADGEARAAQQKRELADLCLINLSDHLAKLERRPDGWEFGPGERVSLAEKIKQDIRPALIEELATKPFDLTAATRRVQELAEIWLEEHATSGDPSV